MASRAVRIDASLVQAAKEAGGPAGLSADDQIVRRARLGRAAETAIDPSTPIGAVMARACKFDSLTEEDQAAVSALWNVQMSERIASLDLAAEFEEAGLPYAHLDEYGNAVRVPARKIAESSPSNEPST